MSWKQKINNEFYRDNNKRIAIGYDNLQWIVRDHRSMNFFGTIEGVLVHLWDQEIKRTRGEDLWNNYQKSMGEVVKIASAIDKYLKGLKHTNHRLPSLQKGIL